MEASLTPMIWEAMVLMTWLPAARHIGSNVLRAIDGAFVDA
jgi:hypothetical protein